MTTNTMEIALCVIVASYFAFAFRDVQSVLYIIAVAYLLHMFVSNPQLFSNGSATTTPRTTATTNNSTLHFDQQDPVAPSQHKHKQPSQSQPAEPAPLTQSPTSPTTTPAATSTRSLQHTVQHKPSRYTFDPVNGGVVHSPLGSPRPISQILAPTSTAPVSSPGLRRPHRVPDISAGRSPVLPVRSASPVSYFPNERLVSPRVAQPEVLNQIVRTELTTKPQQQALDTVQATPAERPPHRRTGSHYHRHHPSHSHSHRRGRSSRSPLSFSDCTAVGAYDQDYDSDSSRASTSSTRSSTSTHMSSYGLPNYEKHYTMIVTLSPKRAGYLPQIQSIVKAVRPYWLSLPGSVSHEVGHDSEAGTVVIVETYESKDDVLTFEQSKEREKMLARLKPFIEESKTTITRLAASSAATRYR